jgi:hypothetical protein
VGSTVGSGTGSSVGSNVGTGIGWNVGSFVEQLRHPTQFAYRSHTWSHPSLSASVAHHDLHGIVGKGVGCEVGSGEGSIVGSGVGGGVGSGEGSRVGGGVGEGIGFDVGSDVGSGIGCEVGSFDEQLRQPTHLAYTAQT